MQSNYLEGHQFTGIVCHGNQLGRTIGFPTANLMIGQYPSVNFGVYVSRVELADGRTLAAVANLGVKPTVGSDAPLLEVHILDFAEDIYGTEIAVELGERLRPEERFNSLDALKDQLRHDRDQAAEMHAHGLAFGANS